jgi:hypothetical protein
MDERVRHGDLCATAERSTSHYTFTTVPPSQCDITVWSHNVIVTSQSGMSAHPRCHLRHLSPALLHHQDARMTGLERWSGSPALCTLSHALTPHSESHGLHWTSDHTEPGTSWPAWTVSENTGATYQQRQDVRLQIATPASPWLASLCVIIAYNFTNEV